MQLPTVIVQKRVPGPSPAPRKTFREGVKENGDEHVHISAKVPAGQVLKGIPRSTLVVPRDAVLADLARLATYTAQDKCEKSVRDCVAERADCNGAPITV
jgi:hypothetical protein